MEESAPFQFIIESPQNAQGHKKRPRLVTSCDSCRLKKIKCLQPSPEAKCEACKAAKVPCKFRDRERYFAERSRAIAGPHIGSAVYVDNPGAAHALDPFSVASRSSSSSNSSDSRSTSRSPKPHGVAVPDGEHHGRYQPYPPDSRRSFDSHRHAGSAAGSFSSSRDAGYPYLSHGGGGAPHSRPSSTRSSSLFDPERPEQPHPVLMQHFIQVFFENLGQECGFIKSDDIAHQLWERKLPPLLANTIAAMGSRYSNHPDLIVRGLPAVSEAYEEMAKSIYSSAVTHPNMDTLHAMMLTTWSEYKSGRISSFQNYLGLCMRMSMDIGLSEHTIHMAANDRDRKQRQDTWSGLLRFSMTAQNIRQ